MKTNYKVLAFTVIINFFMALSLNSFSSSSIYLPVMFLYFLSNLAAFLDKISYYKDMELQCERKISLICFVLCFLAICVYIANSINCIEIKFHPNFGTYKILMQGIQNSFFTFNSIDITLLIFSLVFVMPFAYLLLCIIPYLREHGFTKELVFKISLDNIKVLLKLIITSILPGIIGIIVCHLRYNRYSNGFGEPQYYKYFLAFSITFFIASYIFFLRYYKRNIA